MTVGPWMTLLLKWELRGLKEVKSGDPGVLSCIAVELTAQYLPWGSCASGLASRESVGMRAWPWEGSSVSLGVWSCWLALRLWVSRPISEPCFLTQDEVWTGQPLSVLPNLPFGYPIRALMKFQRSFNNSSSGVF